MKIISILTLLFIIAMAPLEAQEQGELNEVATVNPYLQVNINTASAEEIAEKLLGVGASKAQAIVVYRHQHGEFSELDQLLNVKGIGQGILDKNRNLIRL